MVPNVAPEIVTFIVDAIVYRPDGASLDDIINGFPNTPERKQAEEWVAELIAAEILESEGGGAGCRYFALQPAFGYTKPQPGSAPIAAGQQASETAAGNAGRKRNGNGGEKRTGPINAIDVTAEGNTTETPQRRNAGKRRGKDAPVTDAETADLSAVLTPLLEAAIRGNAGTNPGTAASTGTGKAAEMTGGLPATLLGKLAKPLVARLAQSVTDKRTRPWVIGTALMAIIAMALMQSLGASPLAVLAVAGSILIAGMLFVQGRPETGGNGNGTGESLRESDASPSNVTASGKLSGTTQETPAGTQRGIRRKQIMAAVGLFVVALTILIFAWRQRVTSRPSVDAVSGYLTQSLAPVPVRVAALDLTFGTASGAGTRLGFHAVIETTEPLYRRIDTGEYLHTNAAAEMTAIDAAETLLRGPSGTQLRSAVGVAAPVPALADLHLLTAQLPPHTAVAYSGALVAWRKDGAWLFLSETGELSRAQFTGTPKTNDAATFAVDWPIDAARLKALIAAHVAYAAKVQAAAVAVGASVERDRQQRVDAFAQMLRVGALFSGTLVNPSRNLDLPVVLEVAAANPNTRRLTVNLHIDGGGTDIRPLRGEWSVDRDADVCTINVQARGAEEIAGAGPLLQYPGDWPVVLELRGDGTATGTEFGRWQLHHLGDAEALAKRTTLRDPIAASIAATAVGKVYHGTATKRAGNGTAVT